MPSSMMSPIRIITIISLVALSALSFSIVFGTHNILYTLTSDTLAHDSLFSFTKNNIVHHHRALHHARATSVASESNSPQSDPAPSQSAPSTPDANTEASSPAPVSSPTPTPSPTPSSQPTPVEDTSSSAPSPSRAASTLPSTSAASATASPSSTPSLSSSSSLNAQASSSLGVVSSTVGVTSNNAKNPTTTFINNPATLTSYGSPPTESGSTISAGATPSVGATSGFFNNKAAVGATFSIIGIIGGLSVIMAVLTIKRRRRRARYMDDEDLFEKYPAIDLNEPVPHVPPGFGTGSDAASVMDFDTRAAPVNAYPDRAVHYGQSDTGAVLNPVDYGIAYPPGAANNNNRTPASGNGNTHEDTESQYSVPSGSHPFADPANTAGPNAATAVTYNRPIAGRAQEMVATDSYYGPNSAGVGASGMGYAQ